MNVSVVIPVKIYSQAKTRLDIAGEVRADLCHLMLEEMIVSLQKSPLVREIVVVTREARAESLCRERGVTILHDEQTGVNEAVALADSYLQERGAAISIVLPQDLPLVEPQDIAFMLKFFTPPTCVMVVPSRRFDGTNALLRCPPAIMGTHYDQNSYRRHMESARAATANSALVYSENLMLDVDNRADLQKLLETGRKPALLSDIRRLLDWGPAVQVR